MVTICVCHALRICGTAWPWRSDNSSPPFVDNVRAQGQHFRYYLHWIQFLTFYIPERALRCMRARWTREVVSQSSICMEINSILINFSTARVKCKYQAIERTMLDVWMCLLLFANGNSSIERSNDTIERRYLMRFSLRRDSNVNT